MKRRLTSIFEYEGKPVRVQSIDGKPWWVLADVCDILGLANPSKTAERLPEKNKGITLSYTLGGEQEMLIINEPGLYRVIMRSDKPEAVEFQDWVCETILPDIAKRKPFVLPQIEQFEKEVKKITAAVKAFFDGDETKSLEEIEEDFSHALRCVGE